MRRLSIVAALAVSIAGSAAAQEPDELRSDRLLALGTIRTAVRMHLSAGGVSTLDINRRACAQLEPLKDEDCLERARVLFERMLGLAIKIDAIFKEGNAKNEAVYSVLQESHRVFREHQEDLNQFYREFFGDKLDAAKGRRM